MCYVLKRRSLSTEKCTLELGAFPGPCLLRGGSAAAAGTGILLGQQAGMQTTVESSSRS